MMRLARTLIAGTALAILPLAQACAGGSSEGSIILNGQVDFHTSIATDHSTITNVAGDVGVQSTAAGNALDVTTMNDTYVSNSQYTSSVDISSDMGASISNVDGSVSVQGQAMCNSAQISTDPSITQVNSNQVCNAIDPTSKAYVDATNIGGNFSVANNAGGNTFEEDSNAPYAPITTNQMNASNVNAQTTVHVMNVAGSVNVSTSAIGNNAQIVHYGN
jgi:hypothetical protein